MRDFKINKKALLLFSGLLSIILIIWDYLGNYFICDFFVKGGSATNCPFILTDIGVNLFPFIPLFLLSLLTYKMRDSVYRAWLRFTLVWIPLSMLLIWIAPEYPENWMTPFAKGPVAFFSSVLFCVISGIVIVSKYLYLRKSD